MHKIHKCLTLLLVSCFSLYAASDEKRKEEEFMKDHLQRMIKRRINPSMPASDVENEDFYYGLCSMGYHEKLTSKLDELPTPLNPQFVYMLTNILAKNHSDKPSSVHVLDWLAKKGVDFNTVADDNGSSFLLGAWYHACQHRSILLVNKLLELGVNPLKQNASGRSTFAFVIGAAFGLDPISLDVSCSMLQKLDADQIQKARKEVSVLLKRKAGGMRNIQLAASLFTGTLLDEKDTTIGTKACQSCKNRSEGIQKCGTCKAILYCSHSCQKNDWRLHKQICPRLKAIRTLFIEDN